MVYSVCAYAFHARAHAPPTSFQEALLFTEMSQKPETVQTTKQKAQRKKVSLKKKKLPGRISHTGRQRVEGMWRMGKV